MRPIIIPPPWLILFCSVTLVSLSAVAQSSGPLHSYSHPLQRSDTLVQLPHRFVIEGSETVLVDSQYLQPFVDYSLDSRRGILTIRDSLIVSILGDSTKPHQLFITYQSFPYTLQEVYRKREPIVRIDSATGKQIKVAKPTLPFSFDDVFLGSNLRKSGSIVRGFTLGSNRDLSLNSGFRMQMAGNLTDDVEIVAALTDENSPIQPEGTTQTLQELDKVFVEIRSRNVAATLGDFNLALDGGEFVRLTRKLQGAEASVFFGSGDDSIRGMVLGAVARGTFHTNEFIGLDEVQGPYRLTGRNGERGIVVIAGSERVYLNGERVTRGELGDYTIEYGIGEVTFTSRRLISHSSRIIVEFEYAERQYNRNLFASHTRASLAGWNVSATLLREADNKNSPIDFVLSDADRALLLAAGNDQTKASRTGVENVGPGNGQYRSRDSVLAAGDTVRIYEYAPLDTLNAIYRLTFSFVGVGNGDYVQVSAGRFQFAGVGKGSYAPVRLLPFPRGQSMAALGVDGSIVEGLRINAEFSGSDNDANLFSSLGNEMNKGSAFSAGLQLNPKSIRIGGLDLGELEVRIRERYVGESFSSLQRFNEIEFNRKWDIRDTMKADEELREASLRYQPARAIGVSGGYGKLERGSTFSSRRYDSRVRLLPLQFTEMSYDLEVIKSEDARTDAASDWYRNYASAALTQGRIMPMLRYQGEVLRSRSALRDTMRGESFRFNEVTSGFTVDSINDMSFGASFSWRWDDSLHTGELRRVSNSFTQSYGWRIGEWREVSSSLDIVVRRRTFTQLFTARNGGDFTTVLARWQSRYSPVHRGIEADLYYEAASERAAKLQRLFPRVPVGQGSYVYAGDVNGNSIEDEEEFQLARFDGDRTVITVPTDQLFPVVDVKASTRLRFDGSRLLEENSTAGWILSKLSFETTARVEEKSNDQDTRYIYLLDLSRYLNDGSTLAGSNLITQDINLLENDPAFSLRGRYLQRRGLTQLSSQNERTYTRERSIRVRWQLIKEFANQTDISERRDRLSATSFSTRERAVAGTSLSTDWSYRPVKDIEFGFRIGVGQATNFDTSSADMNDQSMRILYSFEGRGQARAELTREEVAVERPGLVLPFELTGGRRIGKTWIWRASLEYRITQFIQATTMYEGRSEGMSTPVHTARAEVRAFF